MIIIINKISKFYIVKILINLRDIKYYLKLMLKLIIKIHVFFSLSLHFRKTFFSVSYDVIIKDLLMVLL